jgi:molybdopterin-guanine dinucleotide biosynthesis protein A
VTAYATPLDAIVLAGTDRNPNRLIAGHNKAFLDMGGRTLIRRVVDALLTASTVDRIFVVGPVKELQAELQGLPSRLHLVEQTGQMLRNAWAGFQASSRLQAGAGAGTVEENQPLLILSCDLPLASPEAVDDFVARCAKQDQAREEKPYALLVGVAEQASVLPFYPRDGKPGLIRPFVELRSGRFRLANIYVCRPRALAHREMLQTGFSHRKAKDWRNVLRLAWSVFSQPGGWQAAWLVMRLQATLMAAKRKGRLYRALRRGNTMAQLEAAGSHLLGGALRMVETPFGGLSLDVDDEEDYLILGQRFEEWSAWCPSESSARPA